METSTMFSRGIGTISLLFFGQVEMGSFFSPVDPSSKQDQGRALSEMI